MIKKISLIYLTPVIIFAVIAVTWKFVAHPLIVDWVKTQVPRLNSSQDIVDIKYDNLDFSLLKMQAQISDVEIVFKNQYSKFDAIQVKKIKAQVNPFDLLIGKFNLTSITIENLHWTVNDNALDTAKSASELPLDQVFKYLPDIPVDKIKFLDADIHYLVTKNNVAINSFVEMLIVENARSKINFELKKLIQTINLDKNTSIQAEAKARLSLDKNTLTITSLSLRNIDSELKVSGKLTSFKNIAIRPDGELNIEALFLCDNLRSIYLNLFPQKTRFPSVSGQFQAQGKIAFKGFNDINAQIDLKTLNLAMDQFKFGNAQVKSQIRKNQLFIDQINLEHPAGLAKLTEIEVEQNKPFKFKTKLNIQAVNMQKAFLSLGLTNLPADLDINGSADCTGQLTPPFDIECATKAALTNIEIKERPSQGLSILKIKKLFLDGSIVFNNEDIQFESQIKIGESAGSAKGVVDYSRGFKIDFVTDKLLMNDIESIAGIDFSGALKLQGSTWGDSSQAKLETEFFADNAVIEKFLLGNLSTQLVFEKSHLYFRKLSGKLGTTPYTGYLDFDFNKSQVEGKIASDKLSGLDVYKTLNNKFGLPFEFAGQGTADISFQGPLNFWKLSYSLKSQLRQGQIADEGFEQLDLNIVADGKKINFTDVQLKKLKSILVVGGYINTEKSPDFKLSVKTNTAYLEEIDTFLKFLPTLAGQVSVNGEIQGGINSPEINLDFNTKQVSLDGLSYLPSQGKVGIDKKYFRLDGQLFGRQIQTNLKWPWKDSNDYLVKLQVRELNLLFLLPLISLPQPSSDFYSRINLDLDLSGSSKHLSSTQGQIKLTDLLLQRGAQVLKLKKPVNIVFENGLKTMDPFDLSGDDNRIGIKLISSSKNETKLDIFTSLKIRILQFLVPFVESINGQLDAQAQLSFNSGNSGSSASMQIFGDGSLTDGSFQLKGFPTAIDNITTPIEFSQSKIFLNSIKANLGQSDVVGSGTIELKGPKNIAVLIQARADNLELTFPEQVTTSGRADLNFFGSWLPYNLKVNYKVNRGLVEKDFGEEKRSAVSNIKASRFLPPQQFEQQSPSLLLDVAVDLNSGVLIKNKLLEGVATGNLNITGSPENTIILGKIEIKQGSKITFKDKPFEVQTANLQFTEANDNVPDIYISALARISDYDINLLVQGVPNKNLAIKPTSQPPLSESDIFSLLALGMTSSKLDQNLSSEAQQQQTSIELLASITNQSAINKKIQEKLGLTVQLAPSVDSTRNIAVPKVVVSRNLLKKLNASYARPLTGDNQNHEVKLQYLFNSHWSGILNYQNKETGITDGSIQKQEQNEGIVGGDVEYKKEFKW